MTRVAIHRLGGLLFLGILLPGCGVGTGDKQRISGTVTFKNQPLDTGRIDFFPTDKTETGAAADIRNGRYSVPVKEGLSPGTYRVVISSMSGQAPPPDELPGEARVLRDRIPAKYNVDSLLKAEVKAGVENVLDFKLD